MRRETEENYILRANVNAQGAGSKGTALAMRLMAFFLAILVLAFVVSKMFPEILRTIPGG